MLWRPFNPMLTKINNQQNSLFFGGHMEISVCVLMCVCGGN